MARTRTLEQQMPEATSDDDLRTLSDGLTDDDESVRESCAQRLAAARTPEAAPYLRHALDDDSEQVRMWGAYGLGLLARPEDEHALRKASESDESPLVRVWAAFGRARMGDPAAPALLLGSLDLPDLEIRTNAADALLTLEDLSEVRPLLDKRLSSPDRRKRVWAAAVLHRLGHRDAFAIWRDGLVDPETRADAAVVAPHLRDRRAARELIRVCAELGREELEAPVPAANDLPLAELLTSPLVDLELEQLIELAAQDDALRADLLTLVLRSTSADHDALSHLYAFAEGLGKKVLAREVAQLLGEHAPDEQPFLLARLVEFMPNAVEPTLDEMDGKARDELFDAVAAAAENPGDANLALSDLYEILRGTRFAEQLSDLPEAPWGEEPQTDVGAEIVTLPEEPAEISPEVQAELDALAEEEDVAVLIERMVAGEALEPEEREKAQQVLKDLEMTAEEFVESLNESGPDYTEPSPPSPIEVAWRTLALGALLARAEIERDLLARTVRADEAKRRAAALRKWMTSEHVGEVLTALERDLIESDPGDWLDEDLALITPAQEAVAIFLWALGLEERVPRDRPTNEAKLLGRLPLLSPVETFTDADALRDEELIAGELDVWESFLWRIEQEFNARRILAGEDVDTEIDVAAILTDLEEEGFDSKSARRKGQRNLKAEVLRFVGRRSANDLARSQGLIVKDGDFAFEGQSILAASDEDLQAVSLIAHERHRALNWLLLGGDWDALPVDDGPPVPDDEDDLGG